jgi:hypothetical protein
MFTQSTRHPSSSTSIQDLELNRDADQQEWIMDSTINFRAQEL